MEKNLNGGVTINVNLNDKTRFINQDEVGTLPSTEIVSEELAMSQEEFKQQLEQGTLVNANDDNGGTVYARLICRPSGGTKYYSDTRDAEGKLKIGKEIRSPYYIGTGKGW